MKPIYPHFLKDKIKIFGLDIKPLVISVLSSVVVKNKTGLDINIFVLAGSFYLIYFLYVTFLPDGYIQLLVRKQKYIKGE